MSTTKPTAGAVYRLKADYGVGPGHLPAGADVTVVGVYPPGTAGLGASDEDVVLAQYERPGAPPQTVAISKSRFVSLTRAVSNGR